MSGKVALLLIKKPLPALILSLIKALRLPEARRDALFLDRAGIKRSSSQRLGLRKTEAALWRMTSEPKLS